MSSPLSSGQPLEFLENHGAYDALLGERTASHERATTTPSVKATIPFLSVLIRLSFISQFRCVAKEFELEAAVRARRGQFAAKTCAGRRQDDRNVQCRLIGGIDADVSVSLVHVSMARRHDLGRASGIVVFVEPQRSLHDRDEHRPGVRVPSGRCVRRVAVLADDEVNVRLGLRLESTGDPESVFTLNGS